MQANDRYLDPHQARTRPATTYEDLLGDALERAFSMGIHELDGLVEYLNRTGPVSPSGKPWTPESYQAEIKTLAQ
ncbi:recombinase-like helix-turn-helix domain-containing protein [Kerstersia similis]|uniref:recombinase-like helix-turn-helix domain-containing protein n=1 Tax=Kerstersia similis TaxID=206505 RepID=UPI0039F09C76